MSIVDRYAHVSDARRRGAVTALLVVALGLAFLFATLRADERITSLWWPAAPVSALAFFLARGAGERTLVLVAVFVFQGAANYVGGSPLEVVLVFSLTSAGEAALVGSLLRRPDPPGTFGVATAARLLLAASVGAVFAAAVGLAVAAAADSGSPLLTGYGVFASHLSASALVLPFAFLSVRFFRTRRLAELIAEAAVGVFVVAVMFLPEQRFALTFAIFPVLMWLVLRFPTGIVMTQVAVICGLSALAFELRSSFSLVASLEWTPYIQAFWIAVTTTCLIFSGLRNDQAAVDQQLAARTDLLRGTIVDARAGFLCLAPSAQGADRFEVLDSTPRAIELLGRDLETTGGVLGVRGGSPLDDLVRAALAGRDDQRATLRSATGNQLSVRARRVNNVRMGHLAIVEVVDVTQQQEDERSWEQTLRLERASKRQLKELDRQKDVFIGAVNHELRAPATNILGHADLLAQDEGLPEGARRRVEVIVRNAERLTALITDVIATTRTAGELPEAVQATVDITVLVQDAVEDVAPLARARPVAVRLAPFTPLHLTTGVLDVQQILENLLGNAVKFALPGSTVSVGVQEVDGRAVIEIANLGHPLSPEEQTQVFERFYRAPRAVADAVPGSGVGLTIARELAHRIRAELTLTSDESGVTVVRLRFPPTDARPATM